MKEQFFEQIEISSFETLIFQDFYIGLLHYIFFPRAPNHPRPEQLKNTGIQNFSLKIQMQSNTRYFEIFLLELYF